MAGEEWLRSFLKRHSEICIGNIQATSLSRAVGFNQFFYCIWRSIAQSSYSARQTWNMDEIGITNVHKPFQVWILLCLFHTCLVSITRPVARRAISWLCSPVLMSINYWISYQDTSVTCRQSVCMRKICMELLGRLVVLSKRWANMGQWLSMTSCTKSITAHSVVWA